MEEKDLNIEELKDDMFIGFNEKGEKRPFINY